MIYDCSEYYNKRLAKCVSYVSCTSKEEAQVVSMYTHGKVRTLVTGFPRHDLVLSKSQARKEHMESGRRRQILISFHYRPWELYKTDQSFLNSDYLRKVNEFLNSTELHELAQDDDLVFIPHARYKKYLCWFDVPRYVTVGNTEKFKDMFVQSDFLITDFSSTSFEFAYMDKPTFVYVPDLDYVKQNIPQYHMENIQNYPHLTWCDTIADVVSGIKSYRGRNAKKFMVSDKMFDYHDTNNTQRMLDWMFEQYGIA